MTLARATGPLFADPGSKIEPALELAAQRKPHPQFSRPLRVAHVITDLDVGGAEVMLARLAEAFDRRVVETTVISLKSGGRVAERLVSRGVPVIALSAQAGLVSIRGLFELWRRLKTLKPDIVQTWLYHADVAGMLAGALARTPSIVWNIRCAEIDFRDYHSSLPLMIKLLAWMSPWPAAVVSNSEAGRRAHERLGYQPRRWIIIPNGLDVGAFAPSLSADEFRKEIGVASTAPLIGMAARFHPVKDHATFIQAAAIVVRQRPDAHFVIAGRGVQESEALRALVRGAQFGQRMRFVGERADMPRFLGALDIAVSSSISEGFPNVVAEAMACGTPCVVTNVGDSARIVADTGFVVPPRDPAAIAAAVLRILSLTSEERETMRQCARARAIEQFSLVQAVDRYAALYEELAGASHVSRAERATH